MPRIALIGGGIASVGAIAAFKLFANGNQNQIIKVDQYVGAKIGVQIHSAFASYKMPSSDQNGYLGRWGAILALVSTDGAAFSALSDLIFPNSATDDKCYVDGSGGLEDVGVTVPYYCASREFINGRIQYMLRSVGSTGSFRKIEVLVNRIRESPGGWKVETEAGNGGEHYDAVILSGGALATPELLLASGLIPDSKEFPIKDHVLIFHEDSEQSNAKALYPARRSLQYVVSKKSVSGYSHEVILSKAVGFRPRNMASIYCTLAGRRTNELLHRSAIELVKKVLNASFSGGLKIGRGNEIRVTVGDENFCSARLVFESGGSKVLWSTRSSPIAVSAFHFHGSLCDCAEIDSLACERIFVGDLSTSPTVRDFNSGTFSFQVGYRAMNDALSSII